MPLENHILGHVKTLSGRKFFAVERKLADLQTGIITDYINKHRSNLLSRDLTRRFARLAHIPKRRMLFFDIETCGFEPSCPIISIAMAHFDNKQDIVTQCLFARNYSEEKGIIEYFLTRLRGYNAFFTYNGNSFDIPKLEARAIQNGLFGKTKKPLKQTFNGEHYDLLSIGKQEGALDLPTGQGWHSLGVLERYLFNFHRVDDVPSEEIPKVYFEFVYGRQRSERINVADERLWERCKSDLIAVSPGLEKIDPRQLTPLIRESYAHAGGQYKREYFPGERVDETQRRNDMIRLINHNLMDVVSTAGFLVYLVSGIKPDLPRADKNNPFKITS